MSDIYTSLQPVFFMSRMCGLLPLSFAELDIGKGEVSSLRVSDVCFLLMWIVILLTMLGFNLHHAIYSFPHVPRKIKITFIVYAFIFAITKLSIIITTNFIKSGNISKLLKKFVTIDQFIDRRSRIHMYKKIRLRILKTAAIAFLTQTILYLFRFYVEEDGSHFILAILRNFVHYLGVTFHIALSVEYVSIVYMLKCRYEYFNGIISEYFNKKNMATEPPFKYKNVSLTVNIEYMDMPALSGRDLTGTIRALHGRHKISYLRMIYLKIYNSVTLINSYFGFPILLETASMTVMCVTGLYYGLYVLDFVGDVSGSRIQMYATSVFLISYSIFYLSIFAWMIVCCYKTTQEANKGIYFIHRISLDRDVHYSVITELDKLLSQMLNTRVQFTACGLFTLNPPLVCTIFSGILTYILIMVQLS
jgi:hypothetical protein